MIFGPDDLRAAIAKAIEYKVLFGAPPEEVADVAVDAILALLPEHRDELMRLLDGTA